jgi:hypothetical protein
VIWVINLLARAGRLARSATPARGMIAAFWGPAAAVLARSMPAPWSIVAGVGGVALAMTGVLTSGSRTALIAISIGFAAIAFESVMAWRRADAGSRPSLKRLAPVAAGVLVCSLALLVARAISTGQRRGAAALGISPRQHPNQQSARELLWERFGYGAAAILMPAGIRPGAGIGTFHTPHDSPGALRIRSGQRAELVSPPPRRTGRSAACRGSRGVVAAFTLFSRTPEPAIDSRSGARVRWRPVLFAAGSGPVPAVN